MFKEVRAIVIKTGNYQLNAGIVGLYNILTESGLVEGRDFSKADNCLKIDESIFRDHDFGQMYMDTLLRHYNNTVLNRWMKNVEGFRNSDSEDDIPDPRILRRDKLLSIAAEILPEDKSGKLLDLANRTASLKMLESKKRKDIHEILELHGIKPLPEKNDASYEEKKQLILDLYDWLQDEENFNVCQLCFIFRDHVSAFWTEKHFLKKNKQSHMVLLENKYINEYGGFAAAYNKAFIEPLMEIQKKETLFCIECGAPIQPKVKKNSTFTEGIWSDFDRKTSVLWNCEGDTYLCPACALTYSCAPLGFNMYGNEFLFVNNNFDVEALVGANRKEPADRGSDEKISHWFNKVRNIINVSASESIVQNLQVIIIEGEKREFKFISKAAAEIIKNSSEPLKTLAKQNVWFPRGNDFVNLYEQTAFRIMNMSDLYDFIDECLRRNSIAAIPLVSIQAAITERRHNLKKDELKEYKSKAIGCGKYFRTAYLAYKNTEDDKVLNGIIHPLLNSIECSNTTRTYLTLLRAYNAMGIPAPVGMLDRMTEDSEEAKLIGLAFVSGIQSKPIEKGDN